MALAAKLRFGLKADVWHGDADGGTVRSAHGTVGCLDLLGPGSPGIVDDGRHWRAARSPQPDNPDKMP